MSNRCRPALSAVVVAAVSLTAGLSGCGGDDAAEDDFAAYFDSFAMSYDAATTRAALADRSTVVSMATLVGVEDGRSFGSVPDDPGANRTVNLIFEVESGERYFVGIPRPQNVAVERVEQLMPIGASSVIYLQPNRDPIDEFVFGAREDGNEWFFTTAQGWILEHPDLGVIQPIRDRVAFTDAPPNGSDLGDWLPVPNG